MRHTIFIKQIKEVKMTQFIKEKFSYNGGYLEYKGTYEGQPTYGESFGNRKVHPSRIDTPLELFIARFKYSGPFTKAVFMKQLIKNFTVEEYAAKREEGGFENSPLNILKLNDEKWYYDTMFKWSAKQRAKDAKKEYVFCSYDHG
jgi:hypothetical protein